MLDPIDIGNGYYYAELAEEAFEIHNNQIENVNSYDLWSEDSTATTGTGSSSAPSKCSWLDSDDEASEIFSDEDDMGMTLEPVEVFMNENVNQNNQNLVQGRYEVDGSSRRKLIPRLSTCANCSTLGLFLEIGRAHV